MCQAWLRYRQLVVITAIFLRGVLVWAAVAVELVGNGETASKLAEAAAEPRK